MWIPGAFFYVPLVPDWPSSCVCVLPEEFFRMLGCLVLQWIHVHSSVWRLLEISRYFYAKVGLGSEVDSQLCEDYWFFELSGG